MKQIGLHHVIPCVGGHCVDGRCKVDESTIVRVPSEAIGNAIALMETVINPCCKVYGHDIKVIKGYCCPRKMKTFGETDEQYAQGEAVDICAPGLEGNVLRFENVIIAHHLLEVGGFDMMVLCDCPMFGIEPKYIKVTHKRKGENRGIVVKTVSGIDEYLKLRPLDWAQLMSD